MYSSFIKQQRQAWQQRFAAHQQVGWFQRLVAWLFIGLLLMVGMAALALLIVLSWVIIPLWLWRFHRRARAWQQQEDNSTVKRRPEVIEGEVIAREEDK